MDKKVHGGDHKRDYSYDQSPYELRVADIEKAKTPDAC